jgi:hypothetical protein
MTGTAAELTRRIHRIVSGFPELSLTVAAALVKVRQESHTVPADSWRVGELWERASRAISETPADAPYRAALLAAWYGAANKDGAA